MWPIQKTVRAFLVALGATAACHAAFAETIVKVSGFEYDVNGLLTKETIEPDRPQDCLETSYTYDAFGNRTGVSSKACAGATGDAIISASSARTASSNFGADGRFPTSTSNALGQSETKQYDLRFGALTSLIGPNGLTTTWSYDSLGRKVRETRSDGTFTTWSYLLCTESGANCPGSVGAAVVRWAIHEVQYAANGALLSSPKSQFYDGASRVVRVQTGGFDGTGNAPLVGQDTDYDALGRVLRKSNTYALAPAGVAQWTSYTYDALDRIISEMSPDSAAPGGQATTTTTYNGLTTIVTNAKGQTKTTVRNAQGQVASVTDTEGQQVRYIYDAIGQLLATNAAGVVTSMTYTQRGQKASMQDPSMGSWTYAYNAFGELVRQQDSLSQTTTMAYDMLGRMVQRAEPDLTSTWYYDRKADGARCGLGNGKLCEARANNGYQRIHTYDGQGRNSSTSTVLDSASSPAVVSVAFDGNTGRVAGKTWPTGFQATYAYTPGGFLQKVTSGGTNGFAPSAALEVLAMDAQGRVTQYRQGSKVVTQRTYDESPGYLRGQQVTTDGQASGNVINHSYNYDPLGNLTARTDRNTGTQEQFSYDSLNRLTLYMMSSPAVSQTSTQVVYDARGNITYKSDVGTYWYDPQRPNRLTNITLEAASGIPLTGTRELAYAFDDNATGAKSFNGVSMGNGNLVYTVSRDPTNSRHTVRQESYTSFNMPKSMVYGNFISSASATADRTLDFVYGPEHQRTRQQVKLTSNAPSTYEEGTTWYLNGEDSLGLSYEKEIKASGMTEHKHYLNAAGMTFAMVAIRTGNLAGKPANAVRYFHHDHLGSVSVVSDEFGNVIERMAFDPWGKRQNVNGKPDSLDTLVGVNTDRGYTMHEHLDEIGVIHMNGRIYDPLIGRFMSADQYIQSAYDLQSYNRYAYVFNNPLTLTDPTGYFSFKKLFRTVVAVAVAYYTGTWISGSFVSGAAGVGSAFATAGTAATASSVAVAGTVTGLGGAIAGAAGGFAAGVVGSGTLKGGLQGAITGAAFGYVGGEFAAGTTGSYVGHAAVGCGSAIMGGGDCATGAASAFAAKWATVNTSGSLIASAVAGGTISVVGGGKFANGAQTAAFGYLFNYCLTANSCFQESLNNIHRAITSVLSINPQGQGGIGVGFSGGALLGVSVDISVARDTARNFCMIQTTCILAGPFAGYSADIGGGISQGSPGPGWGASTFGRLALPVGKIDITSAYGSDGWGAQAGMSYGPFIGAGIKICTQSDIKCN